MTETSESRIPRARLRSLMRERRAAIEATMRTRYDLAISDQLSRLAPIQAADVLAVYWPIQAEPDLRPLAAAWRAAGKTVALPVMGGPNGGLLFCAWQDDSDLEMGPYGIPIPRD
ncbi:MAG: 5-formyltetrahydrofolate cyclo-ligase, partial [Lautropia sp.]